MHGTASRKGRHQALAKALTRLSPTINIMSSLCRCAQASVTTWGDGDGHLEMLPKHLNAVGFHPANRMSTIHHRDIATAMKLALAGAFDGRILNIADEAPTTIYELVQLVGHDMAPSAEAMQNPWHLHVDGSLARTLGFRPTVRTVYQAEQEGIL